eukprot:COSAG02_NODE_55550_length_290_cov_0.450262_1_plen_39_part_01
MGIRECSSLQAALLSSLVLLSAGSAAPEANAVRAYSEMA